jgi:lysophospholipase L1-like esterase
MITADDRDLMKQRRIQFLLRAFLPVAIVAAGVLRASDVSGQSAGRGQKWVASWAASPHGPYPAGNPSAQPDLSAAFESADGGAVDQTFRLIIKPDLWGKTARLRLTNVFGAKPVTFDDVFVGLQGSAGNVAAGTNRQVRFDRGKTGITIPAGGAATSDPIDLGFVRSAADPLLAGRKLAISFHAVGATGPMTWHAKALTTSYLTAPRSGSHSRDESDARFTFTTTSWYFLEALDVVAPDGTVVVVCFGDSITDGTASTLNGDDRWPDVLSRRLHEKYGARVSVVNAGIGGNRVVSPAVYSTTSPVAGGPSALERFDRDVAGLSGVSAVIWLEGINDLAGGTTAEAVISGMREIVKRSRARGIKIIGATIVSSLGSATAHGTAEVDVERQATNAFIRTEGSFDGFADFDVATRDPQTGGLRAVFQPNSTIGGSGDRLHPNRAGYQAMANAVEIHLLAPLFARSP